MIGRLVDSDDQTRREAIFGAGTTGARLSGSGLMFQPLPSHIGRFEILQKIGEGGMGVVYKAKDPELGRLVAIKVMRSSHRQPADSQGKHRMLREAKAMARLAHPNVVHVYEVDEYGDAVFLAMELVAGVGLRQWSKLRRHKWREVLGVFLQAGQGLAAAHAVGIVHRDFKPDNVLVGDDGRVRVLDFGLARPLHDGGVVEEVILPGGASGNRITLTQANAYVGTPAYMSPEQHLRERADARSDQFSFCVALYEALYGERPFAGKTAAEVRMAVFRPLPAPPRGRSVPARLRRILARGLSVDADERFPDMEALLGALAVDPARPWRRIGLVAAALAAAAAGAVAYATYRDADPQSCDHGTADVAGVWHPARAAAGAAAFAATGVAYAADTWPKVQAELDAYAAAWSEQRDAVCRATHVRGEASPLLLDLRNRCLDDRLRELDALADAFTTADAATVERAIQSATALAPPANCHDEAYVTTRLRPPATPTLARAVEEARRELFKAAALRDAGRPLIARDIASRLGAATRSLDYPPLHAEVALELGRGEEILADYPAAVDHLTRAYHDALAIGHDVVATDAAIALSLVLHRQAKFIDSFAWSEHARSMVVRTGAHPGQHVPQLLNRSYTLSRLQRHDEAIVTAERALEIARANFRPSDPRIGRMLAGVAHAHWAGGDDERALALFQMSKDVWQTSVGHSHPFVASSAINISTIYYHRHDLERAHAEVLPALDTMTRAYGPDHPSVANVLRNLGSIAAARGQFTAAIEHLQRTAEILVGKLGADDPGALAVEAELAAAERSRGRYDEALALHQRTLAAHQRTAAASDDPIPQPYFDLAETLADMRRDAEAEAAFKSALAHAERSEAADLVVDSLARLARLARRRGDLVDADALTRRAINATIELTPLERAGALVERGEVLLALGRADEAVIPCKEALLELEKAHGATHHRVVPALLCLGRIYTARSQGAAAVAALERSVQALEATDIRPADRAEARLALAHAVRASDPARADALVAAAVADYTAAGPLFAADVAALTASISPR